MRDNELWFCTILRIKRSFEKPSFSVLVLNRFYTAKVWRHND